MDPPSFHKDLLGADNPMEYESMTEISLRKTNIEIEKEDGDIADEDYCMELYGSTEDLLKCNKKDNSSRDSEETAHKNLIVNKNGIELYKKSKKDFHCEENIKIEINGSREKVHYFAEEKNESKEHLLPKEDQQDFDIEDNGDTKTECRRSLLGNYNGEKKTDLSKEDQNLNTGKGGYQEKGVVEQMLGNKKKQHRTRCMMGAAVVMVVALLFVIIVIVVRDAIQSSQFYDHQQNQYHYKGN